jgi:hypothetical protein
VESDAAGWKYGLLRALQQAATIGIAQQRQEIDILSGEARCRHSAIMFPKQQP